MDIEFAQALAVAIAKANGHPDPDAFAASVVDNLPKAAPPPPVSNEHVADGATQFSEADIAAANANDYQGA